MEWQGIDLSFSHQNNWLKVVKHNTIKIMISFIISILISLLITFYYQEKLEIYKLNLHEYNKQQAQIEIIENKINKLKQSITREDIKWIDDKIFQRFLSYMQKFQVSGVIDTIQIYKESKVFCKITGKLHQQSEFKLIEQQLKDVNFSYQIDHYQTNEKQQIEFAILITLGE